VTIDDTPNTQPCILRQALSIAIDECAYTREIDRFERDLGLSLVQFTNAHDGMTFRVERRPTLLYFARFDEELVFGLTLWRVRDEMGTSPSLPDQQEMSSMQPIGPRVPLCRKDIKAIRTYLTRVRAHERKWKFKIFPSTWQQNTLKNFGAVNVHVLMRRPITHHH
jgi:hypothetical protein